MSLTGPALNREEAMEQIMDRFEAPLQRGALPSPPAKQATVTNPVCGDVVTVYASVAGDTLTEVRFEGRGCTVSQAAADLTCEAVSETSLAQFPGVSAEWLVELLGVDIVKGRPVCASLALRALALVVASDQMSDETSEVR